MSSSAPKDDITLGTLERPSLAPGEATNPTVASQGREKSDAEPPQIEPLQVADNGNATGVLSASNGDGGQEQPASAGPPRVYITGWRLYLLTFGLCLSLFLSSLETTIVSTSLVSMTNALGGFEQRNWVVTSYLLTYTGFLVITAKFSDIFGRKFVLLFALAMFTVFSIVCGSVSSITALIINRAFQGIGASGIYSLVTVINPEMVPPDKWGRYVAVISLVNVLASVLGPILGGAINDSSTWRWVFLLNAPAGAIATGVIAFVLPTHFPHHGNPAITQITIRDKFSRNSLARLDLLGAFLLLASSILLVFGFEEAGTRNPWNSPTIVSTLTLGAVVFVAFVAWEKVLERPRFTQEPVFPLRLLKDRRFVGMVLVGFLTGVPFMTVLINVPQRFQAVNGNSAWEAGIHTLPLLLSGPVGTIVAGHCASKLNVPPFYLLMAGASLQVLGTGLATTVGPSDLNKMYGFEVLMGFSFGLTLITLLIYVPFTVDRADLAVGMSSVTQIRVLGGTIGLAISATILNNNISGRLLSLLDPSQIASISESVQAITLLPESLQGGVRHIFADAYNIQMRAVMYFSVAVWVSSLLLWERHPKKAKDLVDTY